MEGCANPKEIWEADEEQNGGSISDSEQLDGEEEEELSLMSRIPEELIEGIFSRVSYPHLYKARLLCRSWYSKFLISRSGLVSTTTSTPFQSEVTAAAAVNWPTYGPVCVFGKEIVGYHRSSNCWRKLGMHERVPMDGLTLSASSVTWRLAFAGCLMCAVGRLDGGPLQLLVANTLTGDWNLLPSPPEIKGQPIQDFRLVRVDSQHYRILVHNLPCPQFQAHLYESNQNCRTWTSLSNSESAASTAGIPGLSPFSAYSDAYINGSLYCMSKDSMGGMIIWKFNTETGIWDQVFRSMEFQTDEIPGGMFQFGAKFMVVTLLQVTSPSPAAGKQSYLALNVYELHLQSLKLTKTSRSPPELVTGMQTATLVADAECIYFADIPEQGPASFASFNVNDHSWNSLPSPFPEYKWNWGRLSTFEPGLNPFAAP